ncbi:unnamed protein product [Bursaphelenchus okinawaensis]|uniref:Hexosyltransferase n=1 Tax=Bursaphelenchus okinawaensis TaxID=465554 RepID=A0A811JR80_9BILA|nr:unnamed protein product [Bursaphelenchus okinawaensis]CAG9079074.1 unnamed protein product [Bursaphelenchus okinawaensis]
MSLKITIYSRLIESKAWYLTRIFWTALLVGTFYTIYSTDSIIYGKRVYFPYRPPFYQHKATLLNDTINNNTEIEKPQEGVVITAEFRDQTFTYSLLPPSDRDLCRHTNVLVLIISRPDGFRNRDYIRKSWMYYEGNPKDVTLKFIIGQTFDSKTNERLQEEIVEHMDIVQYEFIDEYDLLPLKVHATLAYQQAFCPEAKYLLKTDDDTVIHLARLNHFIETSYEEKYSKTPKMLACAIFAGLKPNRNKDNKYYVSKEIYPSELYPNFCQGCSYMASTDAVAAILNHTKEAHFLKLEDVLFTGLIAEKANVTLYNTRNFGYYTASSRVECDKDQVPLPTALLGVRTYLMARYFNKLQNQQCLTKHHH